MGDSEPRGAGRIRTVGGVIDAASIGQALADEVLLRRPERPRGNAGAPATAAAFDRAPVTMAALGALQIGAANLDNETLGEADATAALVRWQEAAATAPGTRLVVALAPPGGRGAGAHGAGARGAGAHPADARRALARAARASGVAVVRGAGQAQVGIGDAGLGVTERRTPELGDAGIVGAVAATDPALLEHGAAAAAAAGLPLALAPCASLAELAAGLGRIERAGLAAARVLVTDAAGLIAAEHAPGVPGVGVDEARLDALIDLLGAHGASVVFGGIGEIPSVRTVVSDHDVALAILRAAERGAAQLITLSAGARTKHRLSQYGGGGLEFVHTRFLPYLGRLGAPPDLLRGASSANLARVLRIHREDHA